MADYKDPWDWMHQGQVPHPQNTLPQVAQSQAPNNMNGPTMGPLTAAMQGKAINKGLEETTSALFPKGPPVVDAVPVSDAVPTSYGVNTPTAPASPISTPVQGPATGAEAIQAQPLGPLAAPVEPVAAAASEGAAIAGGTSAGMTAAELEALLAAQAAASAEAAQGGYAAYLAMLA